VGPRAAPGRSRRVQGWQFAFVAAPPDGYIRAMFRTIHLLVPALFAACAAGPWTVRIESVCAEEVPLVQCAVIYSEGGSGSSSPVRARHAVEFAGERMAGAPVVEVRVFWLPGRPPTYVRITELEPSTDGITLRLADPQRIEWRDRRGNAAAVLAVEPAPTP
jgi:hypothetical protein